MSTTTQPFLSLIIPTRERAETLGYTLATALDQTSSDFEVVVSDNASQDQTREVVERCGDPRVRYFHTGRRLSMCDNYEFALERAAGDYVIVIGDDDAVMPGALDSLLTQLRVASHPTIYSWPTHIYDWPAAGQPAKVAFLAGAKPPSQLDLKRKAAFVISMGSWKHYELPSPYHSAVPRPILDAIRSETGRVFHSTQPDVFTAMAIPTLADSGLNVGYTVTLHGRSARSNGLGFVVKSALPNIQRFIQEYGGYHFHKTLFPGVSGSTNMIPDAVLVAMDLFPRFYQRMAFNYDAMWAYVCRLGFTCRQEVLREQATIRRYHAFHQSRFMFYLTIQEISALRRKALQRRMPLGVVQQDVPSNIQGFVRALAAGMPLAQS